MRSNILYNLRPYSWIDLFLIGYLAKFSVTKDLMFESNDLYMLMGLFFLWSFFNLALELRHRYKYRAKSSIFSLITSLIVFIFLGININSLGFGLISIFFVFVYLFKNENKILGNLSLLIRGLVQASYFLYALMIYTRTIGLVHINIMIVIILMYSARALIGDIRDIHHNKVMNKKTFVVNYGRLMSMILIGILLLAGHLILLQDFSILVGLPLFLFFSTILFYGNGYVLHQLMIITTSFTSLNLIAYFVNLNLIFTNLIYIGLLLNLVFYPLLDRKSNPAFKQSNKISFFIFR